MVSNSPILFNVSCSVVSICVLQCLQASRRIVFMLKHLCFPFHIWIVSLYSSHASTCSLSLMSPQNCLVASLPDLNPKNSANTDMVIFEKFQLMPSCAAPRHLTRDGNLKLSINLSWVIVGVEVWVFEGSGFPVKSNKRWTSLDIRWNEEQISPTYMKIGMADKIRIVRLTEVILVDPRMSFSIYSEDNRSQKGERMMFMLPKRHFITSAIWLILCKAGSVQWRSRHHIDATPFLPVQLFFSHTFQSALLTRRVIYLQSIN